MALGLKYQINKHDFHDIAWTTKIYEEAFAGAVTYLTAMEAEPAQIQDCNESDDPIDPIKDKRFYVNVLCTSMFALADFYSVEEMVLWAEVYQGATLYMAGWVDPGEYEEAYGPVPYIARIGIIDGLAVLPKIKYELSDGVPYNGHKIESEIILNILGKVGFTSFREYLNIYEDTMDNAVGDSPLDQCMLNTDVFEEMYCDEVLREILKSYGACIRQQGGVFSIYRPAELTGATVYGRYFTGAATKTAISYTPAQYIQRTGYATTYRQMPGSRVMIQRPAKKITIRQDYGQAGSWIQNHKFNINKYSGGDFDEWTIVSSSGQFTKISSIVGWESEKEGVGIGFAGVVFGTLQPVVTDYIIQEFGFYAEATSDVLEFSFDYRFRNETDAAITTKIWFQIKDSAENIWLIKKSLSESELDEDTSAGRIATEDISAAPGLGQWDTWKRIKVGITEPGPYKILFYCTTDLDLTLGIKNVVFRATSDVVTGYTYPVTGKFLWWTFTGATRQYEIKDLSEVVTREYEATNAINGVDLIYDSIIGDVVDPDIDNIIEQFIGAKAVSVRDSLATVAAAFVTAHAADYSPGGVTVTSAGDVIRFTAAVAGTDFTGSTSISNTSGDLSGVVVNVQPNVPALSAVARIDEVVISGTSGDFYIICDALQRITFWAGTLDATGAQFVTYHAAAYAASGVTVTYNAAANKLIFKSSTPGVDFTGDTSFVNLDGDISGIVYNEATANRVATDGQARIDEITLSGVSGTADVTCDGVTEEVACTEIIEPTNAWNTRGGSENLPLLQLVCNEIAAMRARPRQFVDMIIFEQTKAATNLNLLGNFQDIINIFGTHMRAFIVNRGTFNVKSRTWKLDLIEIGEGDEIEESITVDSTTVTVDSTTVTVDSN